MDVITQETHLRVVRVLLEAEFKNAEGSNSWNKTYAFDRAYVTAINLLECAPSDACIEAVKKACEGQPATHKRRDYESALGVVEDGADAKAQRIKDASRSTSVEDLGALAAHATTKHDTRLAQALLLNPHLDVSHILALSGVSSLEDGMAAAVMHNDVEIAAKLLRTFSGRGPVFIRNVLAHFGAPLVVLLPSDMRLEQVLCEDDELEHLLDVFVSVTPMNDLVRRRYSGLNSKLSEAFVRQLSTIPPEGFRFASALQKGWEGSLTDLLQAIEAVSE
jgi:hypothetical protein